MAQRKKRCCTCKLSKPVGEFYRLKSTRDGRYPYCITCYSERREDKAEQIQETRRAWEERVRREVIQHYGGKCECCGEKRHEFLTVAASKRRRDPETRRYTALWLRRNGYPRGFRVLCHNCRHAQQVFGYCPHYDEPSV